MIRSLQPERSELKVLLSAKVRGITTMKNPAFIVSVLLGLSTVAYAQQNPPASITPQSLDALQQQIKDLQERVIALEGQLRMMKAQPAPAPQPAEGTAVAASREVNPAAPPPSTEVAAQSRRANRASAKFGRRLRTRQST